MKFDDITALPIGSLVAVSYPRGGGKLGDRSRVVRAMVLSHDPWVDNTRSFAREKDLRPMRDYDGGHQKGIALAVNLARVSVNADMEVIGSDTRWERSVLVSSRVLGTWDDHLAAVAEKDAADQAAIEAHHQRREADQKWASGVVARFAALGLEGVGEIIVRERKVTLTADGAARVLAALERSTETV